ncbi:hypothetical protein PCANC_08779 [Puccinia coronata f. sp. avenae]|uniref:J domain-containing protein n=1 Tax=Puccinia coronata f. sp. avenae TaxID=200324 RepID=A0A2N5V874_9BASI|nr:hypothetical protein PCANC_08779 [Puccinia coronata f. sp. avenae]
MEDIADLMFTTTPLKNSQPASVNPTNRKGTSSFDYLSASIARSSSASPHHPISRTISQPPTKPQPPSRAPSMNTSQDAFSSIFGDKSASAAQNPATSSMTIAERLQAAQDQRFHQQLTSSSPTSNLSATTSSAYQQAGLNPNPLLLPGARSITPLASQPSISMPRTSSQSWDFDLLEQTQLPPSISVSSELPKPNTTRPPQSSSKRDSWGIDPLSDFDETSHSSHMRSTSNGSTGMDHMSDSLLGDEFGPVQAPDERSGSITLIDDLSSNEDILGLLGAPIDQVHADRIKQQATQILEQSTQAGPSTRHSQPPQSKSSSARANSPPPHVLGQVVEIGFSPARSRQALVQTRNPNTGDWDVPSTVESLLSTQSQQEKPEHSVHNSRSPPEPRRKPRGPPPPNHLPHENGQVNSESTTTLSGVNTKEIQDQASELLAQASAYGTTALGKAASFWKQGKASLTKVIEDQTGTNSAASSKDGEFLKPKWMKDAEAFATSGEKEKRPPASAPFSDSSTSSKPDPRFSTFSSKETTPSTRQPYVSSARRQVSERTIRRDVSGESSSAQKTSTGDLISSSDAGVPRNAPPPQSTSSKSPPAKKLPTFNFPNWPAITVSQQQIKQSELYRAKGNELFKQGQYGNAEGAYTQAIDILQDPARLNSTPDVYFGSLSLYNNRAAARLKNGDGKGAKSDVERVIEVLFCEDSQLNKPLDQLNRRLEWSQTRVPTELKATMSITEQVGKALSKRARISEESEKWDDAKRDWEHCRNLGAGVVKGAGGMKIVNESLARCSQAVNKPRMASNGSRAQPSARPRTEVAQKMTATGIGAQRGSEAVARLRVANEKSEKEEQQKMEAKDMVDERIASWKAGKESNLRALIASLDTVLWHGLHWKKVSMAELLTEAQVKSKYVRAISKVHPDKVPKDATVAEQMIAQSVFATLNEAWIAMQT